MLTFQSPVASIMIACASPTGPSLVRPEFRSTLYILLRFETAP